MLISKNKHPKKNIYLGIQILRMIFSFNIVVDHCLNIIYQNKIIYFFCIMGIKYYVPTFFFISFYFSYKTFSSRNIIKLKERLLRISVPYIIWPCIMWMKYNFVNRIKDLEDTNKYKYLLYQLIIGKPFHPVFWFQFCLLFWSILIIILLLSFKHIYNFIMLFILIIILYLNRFGLINLLFKNYKPIISRSIKELFKTILYIMSGYFFGSIEILEKSFVVKIKIIILLFIFVFLFKYPKYEYNNENIVIQFIVIIIFIASSFIIQDLIKNKFILSYIKHLTNFTGGIYYLHWDMKYRTLANISSIKKGTFISCLVIYLICYFFCFFNYKIFKKTIFKYLFI